MAKGEQDGDLEERRRVLLHASSLNRADVIKKVLHPTTNTGSEPATANSSVHTSFGDDPGPDRGVLDFVDEQGLTALHYAVRKSSLDAIRVLLRAGIDVTARAGPKSAFPNLTAFEVALSGECKGDPQEIKQIFLTEAVQVMARGDSERLADFIEAGLNASSEYGADDGQGNATTTLADWAEQLGRSDMLAALSAGSERHVRASTITRCHEPSHDGKRRDTERTAARKVAPEQRETPDATDMFVEELRDAIVNLTAECESLEAVLAPRGTLGIVERARSARQELMLADKELETARTLCERWKVEEDKAATENTGLQAEVVEAQEAVQRHRSGRSAAPPANDAARDADAGDKYDLVQVSKSEAELSSEQALPERSLGMDTGDREEASGRGMLHERADEASIRDAASKAAAGSRRKEEADALCSHLQLIAAHLEDELDMMRALVKGEGAGGIIRQIRSLREQIEAAEEEMRQTYSVSRYLEARVMVVVDNGNELRRQLERLRGYLREPPGVPRVEGSADSMAHRRVPPLSKDDSDAPLSSLELEYRGPDVDAALGSDDEGSSTATRGEGNAVIRGDDGDETEGGRPAAPYDVHGTDGHNPGYPADGSSSSRANPEAAANTAADLSSQFRHHDLDGRDPGGDTQHSSRVGRADHEQSSAADEDGSLAARHSSAMAAAVQADEKGTLPLSTSGTDTETGETREGRVRALLSAPGVDAAKGVRGWRRRRGGDGSDHADEAVREPKVTVVQDILSVLFGWEVNPRSGRARGGNVLGGKTRHSSGAEVTFA